MSEMEGKLEAGNFRNRRRKGKEKKEKKNRKRMMLISDLKNKNINTDSLVYSRTILRVGMQFQTPKYY